MNLVHRSLLTLAVAALLALALTPTHVTATSKPYARGKELFSTTGCAFCHGPNGVNGSEGPDLQDVRNRLSAEKLVKRIQQGGGGMPAFADDLTSAQIDDLVVYLRTKRRTIVKPPPPPPAPPTPKPDPD